MNDEAGSSRYVTVPLFILLLTILVVGTLWLRNRDEASLLPSPAVNATPDIAAATTPAPIQVSVVPDASDPVIGQPAAPITLIEYADFECSFCRQFHQVTFPELKKRYIDTGHVKLVFKDFPLVQLHPRAQPAAEAAQCAHQQGKFWEYSEYLWQGQAALADSDLQRYAASTGLDLATFAACIASHAQAAAVTRDTQAAIAAGIAVTPAFVVNQQLIEGAITIDEFAQLFAAISPQP